MSAARSRSNTFTFALSNDSRVDKSTSRKSHIHGLNDILLLSIERGDLVRARRAWTILAKCKEFDWKSKWETSMLLYQDATQSTQIARGSNFELLKKMMRHYPEEQEYILQEIILQLADAGRFQEALDELDLYLPSFPYQDNPVLHFYAGLLSLRLVYSGENGSQHDVDVKVNLLRVAQKHLSKSLVIDPENVVTATFLEETSKQLTSANKSDTQSTADAASDGDMDVDMHRDNNDARPHTKRVRRTPNATQHR